MKRTQSDKTKMKNDVLGYCNALAVLGLKTRFEIIKITIDGIKQGTPDACIKQSIAIIEEAYIEKAKQLAKDYEV